MTLFSLPKGVTVTDWVCIREIIGTLRRGYLISKNVVDIIGVRPLTKKWSYLQCSHDSWRKANNISTSVGAIDDSGLRGETDLLFPAPPPLPPRHKGRRTNKASRARATNKLLQPCVRWRFRCQVARCSYCRLFSAAIFRDIMRRLSIKRRSPES